jgi:hypothetical protein
MGDANVPVSATTWRAIESAFRQTTLSPTWIETVRGVKPVRVIWTVRVAASTAGAAANESATVVAMRSLRTAECIPLPIGRQTTSPSGFTEF